MELGGLHHVTAVTGNAAGNVAFYTKVLGMRLIKKTVNQDDVSAYHLFYGDEIGQPGTELTFFDWPNIGPNVHGTSSIGAIALRVPDADALRWWERRLAEFGIDSTRITEFKGRGALVFADPEGQRLLLVEGGETADGDPWRRSPVPPEVAIRGLHAVKLIVDRAMPTARFLTEALGFRQAGSYPFAENDARQTLVFEVGPGGSGAEIHIDERPELPPGRVGIGGVHHVAFRTPSEDEHRRWRERVREAGFAITPVINRFYFRSIYFREPGGVLFEIATDGPGFSVDEDPAHLGERLALPPFLEPHRAEIEAHLKPI
ncbi:MAG TPA: ring-cleaving dioxygenase [Herpetosiphonaceae bacterium]